MYFIRGLIHEPGMLAVALLFLTVPSLPLGTIRLTYHKRVHTYGKHCER